MLNLQIKTENVLNVPEVHSESGPGQHFDLVAHHTHLVEGWLSVEHHKVIILHVSLNLT